MVWDVESILHPKCLCHLPLCPSPHLLTLSQPSCGTQAWGQCWEPPPPLQGGPAPPQVPLPALGSFPQAGMEVL